VSRSCRYCGEPVLWRRTENDRPIPLNADEVPADEPLTYGHYVIVGGLAMKAHTLEPSAIEERARYTCHLATCRMKQ